jgi:hypothetical protein
MLYLPSDTYSIHFPSNADRPPGKTVRTRIEEVVQVIRRVTEQTSLFHMIPASNQPENVSEADYIMTLRFQVVEDMDGRVVKLMRIFVSAATSDSIVHVCSASSMAICQPSARDRG